jgi:hypothetical protein
MNERLGKLVRLLSSPQDGECLAAARALARVLAESGADFHDLAHAIELGWHNPVVVRFSQPPLRWWQIAADDLLKFYPEILLGDRERDFLVSMRRSKFPPTGKQQKWLQDIRARQAA